jgi:HSP20 family protein
MGFDLIPRSFFSSPRLPSFFEEDDSWLSLPHSSGLTVSEDDKNVYVEAAVPGLSSEEIEVTFDKGTLWIKGDHKEEEHDKKKKFYRKASSAFSYHVTVPGDIDTSSDPEVTYKDGMVKVSFAKMPEVQPRKLAVKKI